MEPDFSGWATKAGLKCSDGRTITAEAFKHMDGVQVPLVWQHGHNDVTNVLGHVMLHAHPEGVRADGFFNETPQGTSAKALVEHKDIKSLSIFANQLVEKSKQVLHGMIREVSLVLSGANPGAVIDFVRIVHDDTGETEVLDDEAVIHTGLALEHRSFGSKTTSTTIETVDGKVVASRTSSSESTSESSDNADSPMMMSDVSHADGKTVQEVYDAMTEEQQGVVGFLLTAALKEAGVEHSGTETDDDTKDKPADEKSGEDLEHKEGTIVTNVFERDAVGGAVKRPTLTHAQLTTIVEDAKKLGSYKESLLQHAVEYGIENIDLLFPDAKALSNTPELVTRRQEWVAGVLAGTKKSPFSRIKTLSADVTHDEARAKGYVKATMKKEEWFALSKRVTTPQTIYKKQKLDRDDIVDITDLDVVAWLKAEMRLMLDEEIARAVLVGDGREVDDPDKIDETHIRPIAYDDDFYNEKVVVAANTEGDALVEAILRARPKYRGTGSPTLYILEDLLTDLLLVKDKMGRRLYANIGELTTTLRVREIVTVPVMEDLTNDGGDILAILVNLNDYVLGADRGGAVSMFDDFDIDFNQYKYLIETRLSGALTKFKSAVTISRGAGTLVLGTSITAPTFVPATGVVTIPTVTGVDYYQDNVLTTPGAQPAIAAGATTEVDARPQTGYYFQHNIDTDWTFTRDA